MTEAPGEERYQHGDPWEPDPNQEPETGAEQHVPAAEPGVDESGVVPGPGDYESVLGDAPQAPSVLEEQGEYEPILPQQPSTAVAVYEEEQAPPAYQEVEVEAEEPPAPPVPSFAEAFRSRDQMAIAAVIERAAMFLLAAGVFLVPVVFDPRTVDSFNLVKITSFWVLGLLAAGGWWYSAHLAGRKRSMPQSRLVTLSLVLLGITTLATLLSPNRTLSFFGLYHRYEGLSSIAIYIAAVLLIGVLFRRQPNALSIVATAIACAGGVVAGYILLQRMGIDVSQWRQASGTAPRFPIGTLGNSAFSASFVGIAAPFVVYCMISTKSVARRAVWLGALILIGLALLFTEGRSGMFAAIAGIGAIVLFLSPLKPIRKGAIVLGVIVVLILTPVLFGDPSDPAQRGFLRSGTAGYRVQIWDASVRIFAARPILGWGPESFFGNYPRFRRPDEARKQGLAITDKPHSIYLGWATATGVAGFGAWLLIVGGAIALVSRRALKFARKRRILAATFGAGLVAYLVQGVYSIDVPPLALMSWIAIGAIAVLVDRGRSAEPESDEGALASPDPTMSEAAGSRSREESIWLRRAWLLPSTIGVIVLFLIVSGFGPLRADHAAWAAESRAPLGWSTDTMELYEKAISLNPREAAYRGLAGSYLERIAGNPSAPFSTSVALRRSVAFYRQALQIQPRNVYFMINVARVYARLGKDVDAQYFPVGDRYIGEAVTLDPLNPQMHDLYVDYLNKWQAELRGRARREVLGRARTQAGIAQALRAGTTIR